MRLIAGTDGGAPYAEFDPFSYLAPFFVLSLMTWPNPDENHARRRDQALAKLAIQSFAAVDFPSPLRAAKIAEVVEELAQAISTAPRAEIERFVTDAITARIKQTVLVPAGGFPTVAVSPDQDALWAEISSAGAVGARVGRIVVTAAAIAQSHPDINPSLNRVVAILEGMATGEPGMNQTTLMDDWVKYKPVAHLLAAHFVLNVTRQDGQAGPLRDPKTFIGMLRVAIWFREFMARLQPQRAPGPLIPATVAIDLRVGLPPYEITCGPLNDDALTIARNYRNPGAKQGYGRRV